MLNTNVAAGRMILILKWFGRNHKMSPVDTLPYFLRCPSWLFKSRMFNISLQVYICIEKNYMPRPRDHCNFLDESLEDFNLL